MIRVLLTLFTCFCLHTLSTAQSCPPSVFDCQNIIGTLRNLDTDEAIPNAKIALEINGKIVAHVVTDDKGNYTFKNMEHGHYSLKVKLYDYDYAYVDQIEITACETQYIDLDFNLSNIVTLDPVTIIDYSLPINQDIGCTQGPVVTSTKCFSTPIENVDEEISTRALPFSNKNPQKPIKELSIYPNPSFGQVNVELTFETLELRLFDMLGHNLGVIPFEELEKELISVDLSNLPAGTYALQLKHEEGTDIQKIIILTE